LRNPGRKNRMDFWPSIPRGGCSHLYKAQKNMDRMRRVFSTRHMVRGRTVERQSLLAVLIGEAP
ncbi:MAG: hypothetical protein MUQ48_01515, partial [Pirellulales bacterium]|nr:hypothetical protein [Pirellulales bacterium]